MQEERPNWDQISAKMNGVRTKTLLSEADVVVVRFGDKYRQWNAAFDAGYARWKATDYLASARDQSHAQEVNASPVSSVKKLNKLSKR
jgi:YtoQ family protein